MLCDRKTDFNLLSCVTRSWVAVFVVWYSENWHARPQETVQLKEVPALFLVPRVSTTVI
jgi:hypothetical protein